ncbi:NTP pyrophosphohydrolase including oxidative damage repair enzyme [Candidatus Burkholderia crenata]|nr:NTP pyrophosphohydrolase including oxidative damage repair enzyme [Candidatus Burkholderia crenata]
MLLCYATETSHWDIPKGQGEADEQLVEAALRELVEKTGIVLKAERLKDLGRFVYRRDGTMIPEMDAYRWVTLVDIDQYASRAASRGCSQTTLSLTELHQTLA